MKTTRTTATAVAVMLLTQFAATAAYAQSGAKALFYGASGATLQSNAPAPGSRMSRDPRSPGSGLATGFPSTPGTSVASQPQDYVGVSYWVELLEPSGQLRRVTADHVFRSGDRIRLNVQSNRDGYLTVLALGSTGRAATLFPGTPEGASNQVRAGQLYQVPPASYLRFDNNPGEETLIVMLSPTPLGGAPTAASAPPPTPAPAPTAPTYSPGPTSPPTAPAAQTPAPPGGDDVVRAPAPPGAEAAAKLVSNLAAKGAKDLMVETDRTGPQPATYGVVPAASLADGGVITLQVKLRHR